MVGIVRTAALAAMMSLGLGTGAQASAFLFQFDNNGLYSLDGIVTSPLVGGGFLSTSASLGLGLYALDSLPDLTLSFDVNGDTFSLADLATPFDGVAISISQAGAKERLVFTENPNAPISDQDGGPVSGSLDLVNTNYDLLTFEPSFFGGNNLYEESGGGTIGDYLALSGSVPEPGAWAMMLIGLGVIGVHLRARRLTVGANL